MAADAFKGLPQPFSSMVVWKHTGFYLHNALWNLAPGEDIEILLEWAHFGENRYRRATRQNGAWSLESRGSYVPCSGEVPLIVNGKTLPGEIEMSRFWDNEVA